MKYTGADKSPYDIRTFAFKPTKAGIKGGKRYNKSDIEDQEKVGICTSISLTQQARKVTGTKYSADFQYLLQKKYFDGNWTEGSSAFASIKMAKQYGLLPNKYFTKYKISRNQSYSRYIKKLQAISEKDIQDLLKKTEFVVEAYAYVAPDRDKMADAIDESEAGIITRYAIDKLWWTGKIEPLRPPTGTNITTGHLVIDSNYDGDSFRIANTWGGDWADKGTAYRLHAQYRPTEAWIVYYQDVPDVIVEKQINRQKIIGQIMDYLQKIIELLPKLA